MSNAIQSVRVLVLAQSAYAAIKGDTFSMDVQLSPGRSAKQSLTESAQELREQAERLLRRAARIEQASHFV